MRIKYIYIALFATLLFPIEANTKGDNDTRYPLNLKWGTGPADKRIGRPVLDGYQYNFGSPEYGQIRYSGKSDIFDMTSEVILYYVNQRLSSALLILGPSGINEDNCVAKYKQVINGLNKKYGFFRHSSKETDPLIHDLIFVKKCHAIKLGMEFVTHKWYLKNFRIESYLYGDEETIFIDIEYYYLFLEKKEKEKNLIKNIKKL